MHFNSDKEFYGLFCFSFQYPHPKHYRECSFIKHSGTNSSSHVVAILIADFFLLVFFNIFCRSPLFTQSCLINLPDWPTLGIAPRVNWFKFGSNWVKIELPPSFQSIAQFFTDSEASMGVLRRKTPFEGSREMENWAIWRKLHFCPI